MRRWKPPTPKLGRDAVILALVTLTAGALVWIAGHEPQPEPPAAPPPPPPDAAAPVTTRALPADPETLVPLRPAAPNPLPAGPEPSAEPEPASPGPERAASTAPPRPALWTVIDAERYNITPATVPLYARLPGTYEWPLPDIDRLELICFRREGEPGHLGIMQTTDGRLLHWGDGGTPLPAGTPRHRSDRLDRDQDRRRSRGVHAAAQGRRPRSLRQKPPRVRARRLAPVRRDHGAEIAERPGEQRAVDPEPPEHHRADRRVP